MSDELDWEYFLHGFISVQAETIFNLSFPEWDPSAEIWSSYESKLDTAYRVAKGEYKQVISDLPKQHYKAIEKREDRHFYWLVLHQVNESSARSIAKIEQPNTALWSDPRPVVNSQCAAAVEPNFSCYEDMPLAVGHWRIYQKRWLARWWQTQGIRVLVDLNVAPRFAGANLLGVPRGWRAYCTRGYLRRLVQTEREYETACNHAGASDILFCVYGGSRKLRKVCALYGWHWVPECMDQRRRERLLRTPYPLLCAAERQVACG